MSGLQAAIVGIIAATGIYMTLKNIFAFSASGIAGFDLKSLVLTFFLAGAYFIAKKLLKGKISPIQLIAFSAVAGVAVYGI